MAKYQVTHTCGHTHTHTLFGKGSARESKLAWLATQKCADCWKSEQDAKNEATNRAAAEQNQANNLPELTGTPKQIAWAETIRAEKIATLDSLINKDVTPTDAETIALLEKVKQIINAARNQTEAAYWIDNRTCRFDAYWLQKELKK